MELVMGNIFLLISGVFFLRTSQISVASMCRPLSLFSLSLPLGGGCFLPWYIWENNWAGSVQLCYLHLGNKRAHGSTHTAVILPPQPSLDPRSPQLGGYLPSAMVRTKLYSPTEHLSVTKAISGLCLYFWFICQIVQKCYLLGLPLEGPNKEYVYSVSLSLSSYWNLQCTENGARD